MVSLAVVVVGPHLCNTLAPAFVITLLAALSPGDR
jgi:hypothetical protein